MLFGEGKWTWNSSNLWPKFTFFQRFYKITFDPESKACQYWKEIVLIVLSSLGNQSDFLSEVRVIIFPGSNNSMLYLYGAF